MMQLLPVVISDQRRRKDSPLDILQKRFASGQEFKGMKNMEVTFPLIEDITMAAANKYGVIQPRESSTKAVRAVSIAGALTDCLRRSLL